MTRAAIAEERGLGVRPAALADARVVARLIVELWRAELPGLLRGGEAATARFLERHLVAGGGARLAGLHVAESGGAIVALGGLATAAEPRPPVWRDGMAGDLVACFGRAGTARLLPVVVRNALSRITEDEPDVAYVHSVVVAPEACGYGHGRALVAHLERAAAATGCSAAVVQVIAGNDALGFWRRLGYRPLHPFPRGRLARRLGVGSEILGKPLAS